MVMQMQDPRSLFMLELGRMYDSEQQNLQMLQQMHGETQHSQFKSAIAQHINETQQQIRNLEQCGQVLGQQVVPIECNIPEGFIKDKQELMQQNPAQPLVELANLGSVQKFEHLEVGAYQSLIDQARAMNVPQCVNLLEQNLQQEQTMAQQAHQLEQQVSQQVIQGRRAA